MIACEAGSQAMVDMLLKRGASVNDTNTVSHLLAKNSVNVIFLLIQFGTTALMLSAREESDIFCQLLDHDADPTKKDYVSYFIEILYFTVIYNHH
jgi:ankyrin repeat protein